MQLFYGHIGSSHNFAVSNTVTSKTLSFKNDFFKGGVVKDEFNSISQTNYFFDNKNNISVIGEIRIYNLLELQNKLNFTSSNNHEIFILAYLKWGLEFLSHVNGDFSFALWDEKKQHLFCARDPLGQKPFIYSFNKEQFIFSSNFKIIHQNTEETKINNLDNDWIIHFLSAKYNGKTDTIFQSIKRLEPGHYLLFKNQKISITKYWNLKEIKSEFSSETVSEAVQNLKSEIYRSVGDRTDFNVRTAVELSGGLDSSLVAAIAQKKHLLNNSSIEAFTNVMSLEDKIKYPNFFDEWDKANKVALHANIKNHIPIDKVITDPISLMDLFLDINGCPSNFHFSILQKGIYNIANERGNQIILSGFGGDELVSASAIGLFTHTAFQKNGILGLYRHLRTKKESLVKSTLKTFKYLLIKYLIKESKLRKTIYKEFLHLNLLKDDIIKNKKYSDRFKEIIYFPSIQTVKEREDFHLKAGGLAERLETGYQITNYCDLNYSLPLLDSKLIEYYYTIPDHIKADHRISRFLFRQVCKDYLPEEITNQAKPSNAITMPFNKIEMINKMQTLIDYSLKIPLSNPIYQYIDRDKLIKFTNLIEIEKGEPKSYKMLLRITMLSRFFDQHNLKLLTN